MDAPLVGRDDELRLIAESLALAHTGQAQVVWLEGDAGAGKSTLLQRAVEQASAGSAARCAVWRVTCDPAERLIEHGVAEQVLRRAGAADGAAGHAERLLGVLAGGQRTVVLAVDDLHWCDLSSLQTLRYVLRRLDGLRVLVLLAHRPMDRWPDDVRRSLGPVGSSVVAVRQLGVDDVRALAAASGVPLTRRAAARLHDHTQGNAQLVATVLAEVPAAELTGAAGPYDDVFNVLVTAPEEERIQRVSTDNKMSLDEAREWAERDDDNKTRFVRRYYGENWGSEDSYDLVLDTAAVSEDEAVRQIVDAARAHLAEVDGAKLADLQVDQLLLDTIEDHFTRGPLTTA